MVGLDYWYMPTFPDFHHAYGAMVAHQPAVALGPPRRRGARSGADRRSPSATRSKSTKNAVRYELRDAAARVDSARQSFTIIDQDLLAQAKRSLEATQAEYAAGQGDAVGLLDALRSYLQVRIERVRALAELASSQADLERAAGTLGRRKERRDDARSKSVDEQPPADRPPVPEGAAAAGVAHDGDRPLGAGG